MMSLPYRPLNEVLKRPLNPTIKCLLKRLPIQRRRPDVARRPKACSLPSLPIKRLLCSLLRCLLRGLLRCLRRSGAHLTTD